MPPKKTLKYARGLSLPLLAATAKFGIIGRSGSGKTYGAGKLAECMHDAGIQIVILDDIGNWHGLRTNASGRGKGLDILIFGGEHGDIPITPDSGTLVAQMIIKHRLSCVIDISDLRKGEARRFVADFAGEFYHLKKRHKSPVHVFFEEAHTFIPEFTSKGTERMKGNMEDLCRKGRNFGIGWSIITQRPQAVDKGVLNQADPVLIYQTSGDHEIGAIKRWIKHKRRPELEEAVEEIPELAIGDAFLWSPQFLRVFKKIRCYAKRTYDSSATPEVGEEMLAPKPLRKKDLAALREQMAELVDVVEKDDPKALQLRVTQLEAALAQEKAQHQKAADLVNAYREELAKPQKPTKVRFLPKSDVTRLAKLATQLTKFSDTIDKAVKQATEASVKVRADADTIRGFAREPIETHPRCEQPAQMLERAKGRPRRLSEVALNPPAPTHGPAGTALEVVNGKLGGGEKKILAAIRQVASMGREATPGTVGFLSGYVPGGSTYRKYLSTLRSGGYVSLRGLGLTEAGMDATNGVPTPSSDEVLAWWRQQIGGGERAIFDEVVKVWPAAADGHTVAEATGYEYGGSTWRKYLSTLRKLKLIEKRGLKASDDLFIGDPRAAR